MAAGSASRVWKVLAPPLAASALGALITLAAWPRASPAPSPEVAGSEAAALRGELEQLRGEVFRLREELALHERAPAAHGTDRATLALPDPIPVEAESAPAARSSPPDGSSRPVRRYVRFDPPTPAVSLGYDPSGTLEVVNEDPSLAGQKLTVRAYAEDGTLDYVDVVIPPPRH